MPRSRATTPVTNAPRPTKVACASEIWPTQPIRMTSEAATTTVRSDRDMRKLSMAETAGRGRRAVTTNAPGLDKVLGTPVGGQRGVEKVPRGGAGVRGR